MRNLIDLTGITIGTVLTSVAWGAVIYKIYQQPELLEKWVSHGYRLISWAGDNYEKIGIAKNIQASLKGISRTVNKNTKNPMLPYDIKIKWVQEESIDSFVNNGKIVVRMKHFPNQAKNFMLATLNYAELGVIPSIKNMLETNLSRAIELIFTLKVFEDTKRYDSKQLFLDEVYIPEVKGVSTLERYCIILDKLKSNGQFTRIALNELNHMGQIIPEGIPNKEIRDESVAYIKMLERFANRRRGGEDSPDFKGKYIKTSIVLIAKPETFLLKGLSPYLGFINRSLQRNVESFYVCAIGDKNVSIASKVADAYRASKVLKIESIDAYKLSKGQKATCIVLRKINS